MSQDNRKVAVVTGASRGAGAGIARALGAEGYAVYVTGRTVDEGAAPLPGSITGAARAVDAAGGRGVAAKVDHSDDRQVAALFEQVARDEGRLDILVNNAAAIEDDLVKPGGFWERPLGLVDILDVGLRSGYVASYYAAPLLVRTGGGLIAFTSSFGSVCYMHGPAYGAQKAGVDKMAADMAVDLREHDVAATSIWMGPLITERTQRPNPARGAEYDRFFANAETPEFTGRLIAALHADPGRMDLSGQTVIGAEFAERYGITEDGGRKPPSYRAMLGEPREPSGAIVR
jgi:NAD(P)-dependent dehydrogenase (short-subunit alcohol dehydrogenase family)